MSAPASSGPGRPVPSDVLLRSLAVQGSWNYESLTGTGFAFAMLPALRRIHGHDSAGLAAALRRHEGPFNCHPYLAPLALGAVIRMEEEGEDPETIDRFKSALRGSLGTLGDQLVWTGWRPVCLLATLILLILGAPWWVAASVFLIGYNLGHVALMYWGFSVGHEEGRGMAGRLQRAVSITQPRLMVAGAFLAGVAMVLVAGVGVPGTGAEAPDWPWVALAGLGIAAGARWGDRVRGPAVAIVMAMAVIGVVSGWLT